MPVLRSIDIDFDIHKLIEAERSSFEETPNDVLRRLLNLQTSATQPPRLVQAGKSWHGYGVTLPHSTKLRMSYNGNDYSGQIDDGQWIVEGKRFSSPSGAASGVARTKKGTLTRLDGWQYWEVQMPESAQWMRLWEIWEAANPDKVNG